MPCRESRIPDTFKGFQRKFDFSDFPRSLRYVDLSGCQFDGVDHFPAGLAQNPARSCFFIVIIFIVTRACTLPCLRYVGTQLTWTEEAQSDMKSLEIVLPSGGEKGSPDWTSEAIDNSEGYWRTSTEGALHFGIMLCNLYFFFLFCCLKRIWLKEAIV